MQVKEAVGYQIVYVDYLLESGAELWDAELLGPVLDNLNHVAWNSSVSSDARRMAGDIALVVRKWRQLGTGLSRDSVEQMRARLKSLRNALRSSELEMGHPGGAV